MQTQVNFPNLIFDLTSGLIWLTFVVCFFYGVVTAIVYKFKKKDDPQRAQILKTAKKMIIWGFIGAELTQVIWASVRFHID